VARDMRAMQEVVSRSAALHVEHIRSGDPFEMGSSRPLDYGHWAAHKLEQVTDYRLRHGEAVAIGIALDTTYAYVDTLLPEAEWRRVIALLQALRLPIFAPELAAHASTPAHPQSVLQGLEEFREHLGGELTIMLLRGIGRPVDVHEMSARLIRRSIDILRDLSPAPSLTTGPPEALSSKS
jgi:3-dehydroquinate synthase